MSEEGAFTKRKPLTFMTVRVRIAPSPTGNLHIGTTRTALLNYLFARRQQGCFILRVEDTDRERSKPEYTENILNGLKDLGLSWDEGPQVGGEYGPYSQSERLEIYKNSLQSLLDQNKIYPCYCTPEELSVERHAAEEAGNTYVYSRHCADLNAEQQAEKAAAQQRWVYRLRSAIENLSFEDLIRGTVTVNTALIGDFIVARQDLSPLYNFAVVVDDLKMKITHVLRGEDHISNTPKQILIYQAFDAQPPIFGHTAMMLAPDRSKLSKRHGATAVEDYLEQGYLPEALVNYLALLGWSAPGEQEIYSLDELVAVFELADLGKSGAVFDIEKLKWVNGQWIRRLSAAELWKRLKPSATIRGLDLELQSEDWWQQSVLLVQEKLVLLSDYFEQADFLLVRDLPLQAELVNKAFSMESAAPVLQALRDKLESGPWLLEEIHELFEALKTELPFKMKDIMWPIRAALSGRTFGADLQTSMLLLGRERCLERIDAALTYIDHLGSSHV